ncbi:hypothetical protein L1987_87090 [Smallanthus sonchifolius]|nr:hypothetical protein L1987_87090 [Smallanthus sonchifolius]
MEAEVKGSSDLPSSADVIIDERSSCASSLIKRLLLQQVKRFGGTPFNDLELFILHFFFNMNNSRGQDQETPVVAGFEVPRSPDASYNNIYTASEDDGRDPPVVPQHLQHTVLSYPTNRSSSAPLPDPQHVILNHLYIENREAPRSVVALGFSHRFRAKYVNVVLYKPVHRRGSSST